MKEKPILIVTKISGLILSPWVEIYPKAHKNPRALPWISGPIYLESSIQCPCGVGLHQFWQILLKPEHEPST